VRPPIEVDFKKTGFRIRWLSIEALKQELSALNFKEQRHLTAFLVSLQDAGDVAYRQKLSTKIDKPVAEFATLEELDRRLELPGDETRK
jgi:hypothetical protein